MMKSWLVLLLALGLSSCVVYYQKEEINTDNLANNDIGEILANSFPQIDEQEILDLIKSKIKSKYYSSKEFKQAAIDSGMVCDDKLKKCTCDCGYAIHDIYAKPYWTKNKEKTLTYHYTISLDYSKRDAIVNIKRHIEERKYNHKNR